MLLIRKGKELNENLRGVFGGPRIFVWKSGHWVSSDTRRQEWKKVGVVKLLKGQEAITVSGDGNCLAFVAGARVKRARQRSKSIGKG